MHAEKCPICGGRGSIHEYGWQGKSTACDDKEHVCHGCNGKGWVEVTDTETVSISASYIPPWAFSPTVPIQTDAWYR